jgi:hypothetical protein
MRLQFILTYKSLGQSGRDGEQYVDLSWWPKPDVWEKSVLNVGYWSDNCESWFQDCLAKIRGGLEHPKGASAWRSALKKWKKTHELVGNSRDLAAAFLL